MTRSIENVCNFDYRGYCKYKHECLKHHFIEICYDKTCRDNLCAKRHPRNCYFFTNFRNCKFGNYCKYLHETPEPVIIEVKDNVDEVKKLKNENEVLLTKNANLESDIRDKNDKVLKLKKDLEIEKNKTIFSNLINIENDKLKKEIEDMKKSEIEKDGTINKKLKNLKPTFFQMAVRN